MSKFWQSCTDSRRVLDSFGAPAFLFREVLQHSVAKTAFCSGLAVNSNLTEKDRRNENEQCFLVEPHVLRCQIEKRRA